MFIWSSISGSLAFWLVDHTLTYGNSELKVFENIKFLEDIPKNWPNDLLGIYVYNIPPVFLNEAHFHHSYL